jgi:hypothetical protein
MTAATPLISGEATFASTVTFLDLLGFSSTAMEPSTFHSSFEMGAETLRDHLSFVAATSNLTSSCFQPTLVEVFSA